MNAVHTVIHTVESLSARAQELAMQSKGAYTGSVTVRFSSTNTDICVSYSLYSGRMCYLVRGCEVSVDYLRGVLDAHQARGRRG